MLSSETQRPLSTKQICLYLTHMFPNELGLPKESTRSGHEGKEDLDTTFHSAAALSTSKTGSRAAATRSTVVSNIGKVGIPLPRQQRNFGAPQAHTLCSPLAK